MDRESRLFPAKSMGPYKPAIRPKSAERNENEKWILTEITSAFGLVINTMNLTIQYTIDVMLLSTNRTLIKFLVKMYVQYHSTWYTVLYVLYVTTYHGVSVDPALESPRKPRLIYF